MATVGVKGLTANQNIMSEKLTFVTINNFNKFLCITTTICKCLRY